VPSGTMKIHKHTKEHIDLTKIHKLQY
jgi:hypothetical protein